MKLGIVGHAAEKFTRRTEILAKTAMLGAVDRHKPTHIVSGRSPMGGVDIWAEDLAGLRGLTMVAHAPTAHRWDAPGGFKERNLAIAADSDVVLVVVVRELPPNFTGMPFPTCYHCRDRNPPHVKSGGCWTAWQAEAREWAIV